MAALSVEEGSVGRGARRRQAIGDFSRRRPALATRFGADRGDPLLARSFGRRYRSIEGDAHEQYLAGYRQDFPEGCRWPVRGCVHEECVEQITPSEEEPSMAGSTMIILFFTTVFVFSFQNFRSSP